MSAINIFAVDCDAVTCPDGALGVMDVSTEFCNDVVQSEITSIIFWHPVDGVAPTNWGNSMLVTDFDILNTDATDVKQKQLFLKGGMPEPDETTIITNSFQEVVLSRTQTVTLSLYSFGDDTYDYLRKLQCGTVKPKFIFSTAGGKLYGKDGGIQATKFSLALVLDEGEESVEKWTITIAWKTLVSPDRVPNPLP